MIFMIDRYFRWYGLPSPRRRVLWRAPGKAEQGCPGRVDPGIGRSGGALTSASAASAASSAASSGPGEKRDSHLPEADGAVNGGNMAARSVRCRPTLNTASRSTERRWHS